MVKHSSENGAKKALWRVLFRTRKKKNERQSIDYHSFIKSGKRDSDPRPQPWQGCALPTELFPQICRNFRFGTANINGKIHSAKIFRGKFRIPPPKACSEPSGRQMPRPTAAGPRQKPNRDRFRPGHLPARNAATGTRAEIRAETPKQSGPRKEKSFGRSARSPGFTSRQFPGNIRATSSIP